MGVCYFKGKGVTKDAPEAVKWFQKAAAQGLAGGQYNLGLCYAYGEGVGQDKVEAAKWLRKASDQGYADSAEELRKLEQ